MTVLAHKRRNLTAREPAAHKVSQLVSYDHPADRQDEIQPRMMFIGKMKIFAL